MDDGLRILEDVRRATGLPVLTDVHETEQIPAVAAAVDVLQTPAFLCRQTDFIVAVAKAGKPVNLKKGQFLSPQEMLRVVEKARSTGNDRLLVTERGFAFGYNNLVSDMRALAVLAETGCPVVFDATHSVQQPGGLGTQSGGDRRFVAPLARAAVAAAATPSSWRSTKIRRARSPTARRASRSPTSLRSGASSSPSIACGGRRSEALMGEAPLGADAHRSAAA
jgi:2-dehydro-3-deoxyphosphooctonate aldolase (KDO 8-P synthase)